MKKRLFMKLRIRIELKMIINRKNFLSEYFENKNLDFFNINLWEDSKFFIDPLFIFQSDIIEFQDAKKVIVDFFLRISKINEEDIDKAIPILKIKEPKENRLGLAKNENRGRGIGEKKAKEVYLNIAKIKDIINNFDGHFEGFCIFGKDIGADNISDFVFNILKPNFVAYTQRMIKENKNSLVLSAGDKW